LPRVDKPKPYELRKTPRAPDRKPVASQYLEKTLSDTKPEALNEAEQTALRAASEAFVLIRMLTARPMTPEAWQVVHDMANAFHNVPEYCAGPAQQRAANSFLLEAGLRQGIDAFDKHGLGSRHLPTRA
jgi:hypothetical protein